MHHLFLAAGNLPPLGATSAPHTNLPTAKVGVDLKPFGRGHLLYAPSCGIYFHHSMVLAMLSALMQNCDQLKKVRGQ